MHSVIQEIVQATVERTARMEYPKIRTPHSNSRTKSIISDIRQKKAQGRVPVIAEVKPASPGKKLRDISPADASHIASEMEKAGAVAISVLTEPEFFHGSTGNLEAVRKNVSIPVLRKDFIIDKIQFDEVESDLILLIAGILGSDLDEMVNIAISKGFEPLVETHNIRELEEALKTKAQLIGINNRDLNTLEINLNTTLELAPVVREHDKNNGSGHIIISESGIHSTDDIRKVIGAGADAVLVGTSIIKSDDIYAKTKEFVDALD
ncbi:indole-3-glycerol-phosphate synthase [Methanolobus halotolerans]|uniref:indole-3-glycerol-phosphate synthase n=1 Tax=Methanolobus halotolerans TaxID=2052935 RepID=A0A4E0PW84_9EURY|nr:indole-3-glycerol-phosphate synthase [Methanolobus halotolerans]TGC08693.1 indole-3-glycerol phosphate synthase [Methanolobus halotolerans]